MVLKSRSPLGERVFREGGFAGLCTVLQFGDGGYRFPPGPSDGVIGTSHKNSGNTLEKSKKTLENPEKINRNIGNIHKNSVKIT